MHSKWKWFWRSYNPADIGRSRIIFSRREGSSFTSAFYDRALRTDSYNEISRKISVLVAQYTEQSSTSGPQPFFHADKLLEPPQEAVDAFLQEMVHESPDLLTIITDFFEISRRASTLCVAILQSIIETRGQCGRLDATLSGMPRSGELLDVAHQQSMVQGFSELLAAENAFARGEIYQMLQHVHHGYDLLNMELDARKKVVQRKKKSLRLWKRGCVGIVMMLVAGAALVAGIVNTHVVLSVVPAPILIAVAGVTRDQVQQDRVLLEQQMAAEGITSEADGHGARHQCNESCTVENDYLQSNKHDADARERIGENENNGCSTFVNGTAGEEKLGSAAFIAGAGDAQMKVLDIDNNGDNRSATLLHSKVMERIVAANGSDQVKSKSRFSGVARETYVPRRFGGFVVKREDTIKEGFWCWRMTLLARQSTKLDALAKATFVVIRMLDTLRCLMTGLQETVECNKRLAEYGVLYQQDTICVLQVSKQLFRNHMPLVGKLAKLEEQVIFGFHLINRGRGSVFQKFC